MIYSRLFGGTGNQLFQIAFCRKLQHVYGQDICFDISLGTEYATRDTDKCGHTVLNDIAMDQRRVHVVSDRQEFNKLAGSKMILADYLSMYPRALRKITKNNRIFVAKTLNIQKRYNRKGLYTSFDCYCEPYFNMTNKDLFVNGLFSCRKYFDDILNNLVVDFNPRSMCDENKALIKEIQNNNAVCMHVRKGASYIKNRYLNVCDGDYYNKAMELIAQKVDKPFFYIFSNDHDWCKNNIDVANFDYCFVENNDEQHAIEELALMRECKAYILSNSTFGWWAQYLNNQEKIVVSPKRWTIGKIDLLPDLIETNWLTVE